MICSSARAAVAVVEEEVVEAAVEKAEAVEEVAAVEAVAAVAAVEAVEAVEAVVPKVALGAAKVALEALAVRMFPPRMVALGTLALLRPPDPPCHIIHTSDLTIITAEIDLPAPTSVVHLLEEADPGHNTAVASSTAAARELLTAPVLEAP